MNAFARLAWQALSWPHLPAWRWPTIPGSPESPPPPDSQPGVQLHGDSRLRISRGFRLVWLGGRPRSASSRAISSRDQRAPADLPGAHTTPATGGLLRRLGQSRYPRWSAPVHRLPRANLAQGAYYPYY